MTGWLQIGAMVSRRLVKGGHPVKQQQKIKAKAERSTRDGYS